MNDTIAALERMLRTLDAITVDDESRADASLIRALIERERGGGERAITRTHVKAAFYAGWDAARHGNCDMAWEDADVRKAIDYPSASGAHMGGGE